MGCGTSKPPPALRCPSTRSHSSSSSNSSRKSSNSHCDSLENNHNTNDNKGGKENDDRKIEPLLTAKEDSVKQEEQNNEREEKEEEHTKTIELIKVPEDDNNTSKETNDAENDGKNNTSQNDKENDIALVVENEKKSDDNETTEKPTVEENILKTPEPDHDVVETETETTENVVQETTENVVQETTEKEDKETPEKEDEVTPEKEDEVTPEKEDEVTPEKVTGEPTEKDLHEKTIEEAKETNDVGVERAATVGSTNEENFDDVDDGYDDLYTPFDDDEEVEDLEVEGYVQNASGLMIKSVKFQTNHNDEVDDQRPGVQSGELYTDKDFPLDIAIVQEPSGIEWKRPGEFLSEPVLFHENTTRFDIGQGSAGTCWFLSTVSTIADNDDMIKQVVPHDAYNIENSEAYDGVFHARFFRFGKWEDIYIDDHIPVVYGSVPWGAKSSTNENEVWVSLLEKAFARLHGSYDSIYGGQPGDAYLQLTGGIGERVEVDESKNQAEQIFRRVSNALKSGCQVTCVVPDEFDKFQGLVGGHAYSLVGATEINNTKLIRVRNPWGRGEWKGAWSDESPEFEAIQSSIENVPQKDDGEFYICLKDFVKCFSQTTICSLTPDFDCDGKSDPMNFILNVFGEWTDDKMGGFREILNNPRFSFTVTEEGMLDDGTVPLLIQMIQHTEKRKAGNASIRCDVFKIKADKVRPAGRAIAAEIQGKKNNVYTSELQSSFRHKLKPGRYMAIPSTLNGDVQKAFLLRIFTPAPLKNCREVGMDANILSCENEDSLSHGGRTYELTFDKTMFGAFVSGVNAGGQVSNRDTYSTNPQYLISIPDTGKDVPLVVHIMQTQEEPQYPVGFRLFSLVTVMRLELFSEFEAHHTDKALEKTVEDRTMFDVKAILALKGLNGLDKGSNPPVSIDYLYSKYDSSPADIEGNKSKFMISWDVDVRYLLPAGRYVALVHMDEPNTEKAFAIVFKSNNNIGIKGLQTGEQ